MFNLNFIRLRLPIKDNLIHSNFYKSQKEFNLFENFIKSIQEIY